MIEIKGKMATAVCYARVIEDEAIEQIRRMCDYPVTEGSRVRIMPDVHAGKGCTIGTTMTVLDKAVPNVVGVDIGCGMYTVNLGKSEIDFAKVDEAAHFIPSGKKVWEGRQEHFDLSALRCYRSLKDSRRLVRSLGTLGGGNHFIEIDRAADGTLYLVIHSGSRNLGKQVAELYQHLAIKLAQGKEAFFNARDALIREYKAAGRRSEIQAALKQMTREFEAKEPEVPEDLCYVYGTYLEDYLHDVEICQAFARKNRELMAEILLDRIGVKAGEAFHTVHNYIDTGEMILRKGAIAAHEGEKVLIPINMRDGSVLATGRGNPEWNYSAPHGAGRLMSRTKAKETLDLSEYRKTMEGIYTTSVGPGTLDEAPMAYKSLSDIIDVIRDSVDVIDVMKPVYNFKAGGGDGTGEGEAAAEEENERKNENETIATQA
ncbi:MAG: RtcB family protein [Lachnospiraceae bacterium]|nr:RtcB family protein [Lachnospiraceae bacterium]